MTNYNKNISEKHLMAYLTKEADEQLVREVDEWLSFSNDNAVYLNELEKIWIESGKLSIKPVIVDVDSAWNKLSERIDANQVVSDNKSGRRIISIPLKTFLRIAAVLVIAFTIGAFLVTNNAIEQKSLISQNTVVDLNLSDGSSVSLNKNSKLKYPDEFDENTREVVLEGEAFFDIEPDKECPFIIHSENANIKVLGTSFNVKAYVESNEVEVFVKTGVVMLFAINEETNEEVSVILNVGEKGTYNKETKQVNKIEKVGDNELYWRNKTLIFEETELFKVIEILEDSFDAIINVENDSVNYCKLNAKFTNETIDDILDVIASSFSLKVGKKENKTYILYGEGCK